MQISTHIFSDFFKSSDIKMTKSGPLFKYKGKFIPLTWDNAKTDPVFLKKFNLFRKSYVDTLLNEVISKVNCKPNCFFTSAGSVSLDSDYDVTVYGRNSSRIVELFNDIFISKFKKESSVIFDTNIYGTSFFHTNPIENYDYVLKDPSKPCTPNNFVYYINTEGHPIDISNQHVWAFIKLFMYVNKTSYKKDIYSFIYSKVNYIGKKDIQNALSTLRILKHKKSSYTRELKKYDLLKNEYEMKHTKDIKLAIKLKNQISTTNYFGKETYFTQGAVNHVVGKMQMKFSRLNLTEHEYVDSILENMGDIVKEYLLYPSDSIKFATHSSKYIIRIADAVNNIGKNTTKSNLMSVGKKLRKLRGSSNVKEIKNNLNKLQRILGYDESTSSNIVFSLLVFVMSKVSEHYSKNLN